MKANGHPRFPGLPAIIRGSAGVAYVETAPLRIASATGTAATRELVEV